MFLEIQNVEGSDNAPDCEDYVLCEGEEYMGEDMVQESVIKSRTGHQTMMSELVSCL